MNAIIPFRKIAVSGATPEDADEAIGVIKQTLDDLEVTIKNAILDAGTSVLGVAANFKENSPVGVRIDDIQWRLAEGYEELVKVLKDLRGDIVGRIQNAGDIQQLWGE
jgi:DNA replicative helicase MCM subunit Mcm2 (Cdc46/Mcm family)